MKASTILNAYRATNVRALLIDQLIAITYENANNADTERALELMHRANELDKESQRLIKKERVFYNWLYGHCWCIDSYRERLEK